MNPNSDRKRLQVARNWGPPWFRIALAGVATVYLALIGFNTLYSGTAYRLTPQPLLYLAQISGLFKWAKIYDNEFRVEGWDCERGIFREIDIRPFFPILADDKEGRFSRALYFFRRHRPVLNALDDYIRTKYNGSAPSDAEGRIGGVRFSNVRQPIPKPGEAIVRYRPKTLSEYPENAVKPLYYTTRRNRSAHCAEKP